MQAGANDDPVQAWLQQLPPAGRKKKSTTASWLAADRLPQLYGRDGGAVAAEAVAALLREQAQHKEIAPAAAVAPLLPLLDRPRCGDFAVTLLQQWFDSEQAAADRWALALAGLLGDDRVVDPLASALMPWCEKARGRLAEFAVQALALQGGDAALMALDHAATRFRSRFRNVGAAARKAFAAAAVARGISEDDLADLVVPRFGFDEQGRRLLSWEGGGVTLVLTPEFKLQYESPAGKLQKSLPGTVPPEAKAASKHLTKELRDAAKAQTMRLELCMVRQRRWNADRWQQLFAAHPLLRPFGQQLVFGLYQGSALRSFRVYPNGLFAGADGGLVDLADPAAQVGILHPLELAEAELAAWRAHFARFGIEEPFPQLQRPVARLDPAQHNRRQLADVAGVRLSAMTFRGRAEKRGWVRGSVVDAGGVSAYWKHFPTAGVDVMLPTEGLWIGAGVDDVVTLGTGLFVRSGSVHTGSYVYDEPQDSSDPRVLAFGEVPAVVWSETLGDLQAIAGTG